MKENNTMEQEFVQAENKKYGNIKVIAIIFAVVISLLLGMVIGKLINNTTVVSGGSDVSLLNEALTIISEEWVDTVGLEDSIEHYAIDGMMTSLGDANSEYWSAERALEFNQTVNGNYEGIGVSYSIVEQGAMVIKVYQNTPAMSVGIEIGDILTKVDGESLAGMTSEEIKASVTGDPGSEIELSYTRDGKEITATTYRDSLDISAQTEIREIDGKKYGYILLTTFGTNTGYEVENALERFTEERIDTLVFDFRNNGGGYLSAAKDIGNLFVPEGVPIYQMEGNSGAAIETLATAGTKYYFENSFILVNGGTASAAELVAGTFREVCDFTLIGTTTFGKGTAQTQRELSDGSILKFTYAKWLTSKGEFIGGEGLTPDIEVNNIDTSRVSSAEIVKPLVYDCVSSSVISMQSMLDILGYGVDRTDGYFSAATETALKQFEKDYGLTVDGIYDDNDHLYLIALIMIYVDDASNDYQYDKLLELMK